MFITRLEENAYYCYWKNGRGERTLLPKHKRVTKVITESMWILIEFITFPTEVYVFTSEESTENWMR